MTNLSEAEWGYIAPYVKTVEQSPHGSIRTIRTFHVALEFFIGQGWRSQRYATNTTSTVEGGFPVGSTEECLEALRVSIGQDIRRGYLIMENQHIYYFSQWRVAGLVEPFSGTEFSYPVPSPAQLSDLQEAFEDSAGDLIVNANTNKAAILCGIDAINRGMTHLNNALSTGVEVDGTIIVHSLHALAVELRRSYVSVRSVVRRVSDSYMPEEIND
jgi:hypothetical protein